MKLTTPWITLGIECHYRSFHIYIELWDCYENYISYSTNQSKIKDLIAFLLGGRYSGFSNNYVFWKRDSAKLFDSLFRLKSSDSILVSEDDDIPF